MQRMSISSVKSMNGGCDSYTCEKHINHMQYAVYQGVRSKKKKAFFFFDCGTERSGKYYCTKCHVNWFTGFHW